MTTISDTAGNATEHAREAASHAKTTLIDLSAQFMRLINSVREAEGRGVDSLLDRAGLQRRQSAMAPVLWFAAGAVVAGATVVLMATVPGQRLRRRVASFLFHEERETRTPDATATEARAGEGERRSPQSGGNGVHETG